MNLLRNGLRMRKTKTGRGPSRSRNPHFNAVSIRVHNTLYGLAAGENDYASQTFLQWFVTEQVEEEKNAGDVVETLKMVGDSREALFLLDRELGLRREDDGQPQPS